MKVILDFQSLVIYTIVVSLATIVVMRRLSNNKRGKRKQNVRYKKNERK